MALSKEDREQIKAIIIITLNDKMGHLNESVESAHKKVNALHTRLWMLIGFLAGSGVLGGSYFLFTGGV